MSARVLVDRHWGILWHLRNRRHDDLLTDHGSNGQRYAGPCRKLAGEGAARDDDGSRLDVSPRGCDGRDRAVRLPESDGFTAGDNRGTGRLGQTERQALGIEETVSGP